MHAVGRTLALAPLLFAALAGLSALGGPATEARAEEPKAEPSKPEPKAATASVAQIPGASPSPVTITDEAGKTLACQEQAAQPFLIRGSWFPKSTDGDQVKAGRKMLEDAIKYRTQRYGYFEGYGQQGWNKHPPKHYAKSTNFLGVTVQVNERIIPALKCVEASLKASGADAEYKPRAMSGMRFRNTYRGVEISNHVYGIAVDIEPDKNTCCGCVKPWNEHPLCKDKSKTVYERMVMPRSWVEHFERYGFYWLGHDTLQDTMHFEFLGDPDKIVL